MRSPRRCCCAGIRRRSRFPDDPTCGHYLGYLEDRPDQVVGAVRSIARDQGTALVHCAAGKDRTGVVVALALTAAGVRPEAVVADYAATSHRIEAILDRLRRSPTYARDIDNVPADAHRARPETMRAFLQEVDTRYGGAAQWLTEHGLTAGELGLLRDKLRRPRSSGALPRRAPARRDGERAFAGQSSAAMRTEARHGGGGRGVAEPVVRRGGDRAGAAARGGQTVSVRRRRGLLRGAVGRIGPHPVTAGRPDDPGRGGGVRGDRVLPRRGGGTPLGRSGQGPGRRRPAAVRALRAAARGAGRRLSPRASGTAR